MAQRDASDAQLRKLKAIRKEYGKAAVGSYRVDERTGIMSVRLECAAGVWTWRFDRHGDMLSHHLQRTLDAPAPVTADPATWGS